MKETGEIFSSVPSNEFRDTEKQSSFVEFKKQVADRVHRLYEGIESETISEAKFEPYDGFDENSIGALTVEDMHQWNAITKFEKEAIEKRMYVSDHLQEILKDFRRYREAIQAHRDDVSDDRPVWKAREMFANLLADILEALPQTVTSRTESKENIPTVDEIRSRHDAEIARTMKKFAGGHGELSDEDLTQPLKPEKRDLDSDLTQ